MAKHPIMRVRKDTTIVIKRTQNRKNFMENLHLKKLGIFKKIITFAKTHKAWTGIIIVMLIVLVFMFRPKPDLQIPTETVKKSQLTQSISITGTVIADKEANLTFPVGGTIAYLGVQKGDYIQSFQTIATLDERTVLKNLQNSLLSYSLQRNVFDQKQADNQNRTPDQALNDTMKRILQDNQYNLDKAVVSVEIQDLARQQSILTSPISGILTRADAKTSGVTATPTTVFTITDPNSLSFKMEVDEADISKVKIGQNVNVILDTYPNKTLYIKIGQIDFVSHTTSTGGNAFDVKAEISKNPNLTYRVGMDGNAEIITSRKMNIISIPLTSLVDENSVYVKIAKNFIKKKLTLGVQNDTSVEVLKGLFDGDVIVTDPTLLQKTKK